MVWPLGKMNSFFLAPSSYLAIIVVLILTGSGLPVPEEVPIIAAGILSANGALEPLVAFVCCLFGALAGDCVMYAIGYHFGRGVLRDHRWWARFVTPQREAQIEVMFRRHGLKVFLLARFLVGLRSPVYLTAGILRVSFRRFFLIDLICATSVVGTFFGLTYLFGQHITAWVRNVEALLTVVVIAALTCVVFYFWRRRRRRIAAAGQRHSVQAPPACSQANPLIHDGSAPDSDEQGPVFSKSLPKGSRIA
jgi:membrane protein DedA with SNARE-associated domain